MSNKRSKKSNLLTVFILALMMLTIFSISACSRTISGEGESFFDSIFSPASSIFVQNKNNSITVYKNNKEYTLYETNIITDLNADGKCTSSDARELLRIAASLSEYNGNIKSIDIDEDGQITSSDARFALRYSAKLDSYYTNEKMECSEGFYTDKDGNNYYFFSNGRGARGVTSIDGSLYFFDHTRKMQTGIQFENSVVYYFGKDGKGTAGTITYKDVTYIFDDTGKGYNGTLNDGTTELFYKNGIAFTGWKKDAETFYYQNGKMLTGKQIIDNKCYYFHKDGHMAKNETIDGITFDETGKAVTADASFFDDAIFIGDSVSVKLAAYQQKTKCFGNATMCAASSLSAANSLWAVSDASVHPYYNGKKTLIEDSVKLSGKKKVFIMLGMNDIGLYSHETSIKNYKELVARIKTKSPDVDIYIQSMTLMTSISTRADKNLNNTQIKIYNEKLQNMCKEMGWHYLDVASGTCDITGNYLPKEYCSDPVYMGLHFSDAGCEKWVEYLYQNVLLV